MIISFQFHSMTRVKQRIPGTKSKNTAQSAPTIALQYHLYLDFLEHSLRHLQVATINLTLLDL